MGLPTTVGAARMAAKLAEVRKSADAVSKDGGEYAYARALGQLLSDIRALEIALNNWNGAFIGETPPAFARLSALARWRQEDALDPTSSLDDDFRSALNREYSLTEDDVDRINAVIAAWRDEHLDGSLADAKHDLTERVLRSLAVSEAR